jgi:hypothetical protein
MRWTEVQTHERQDQGWKEAASSTMESHSEHNWRQNKNTGLARAMRDGQTVTEADFSKAWKDLQKNSSGKRY